MALFLTSMKAGRKRKEKSIRECIGPRCCSPSITMSISGRTEARKSNGMFVGTFRVLDVAFPDRYPRARCPTAYIISSHF